LVIDFGGGAPIRILLKAEKPLDARSNQVGGAEREESSPSEEMNKREGFPKNASKRKSHTPYSQGGDDVPS